METGRSGTNFKCRFQVGQRLQSWNMRGRTVTVFLLNQKCQAQAQLQISQIATENEPILKLLWDIKILQGEVDVRGGLSFSVVESEVAQLFFTSFGVMHQTTKITQCSTSIPISFQKSYEQKETSQL